MMNERVNDSILVVDDDPCFRELLTEILAPTGYNIMEARSAKAALSVISSRPYALLIVDYRLPDMDGITLISRFREMGKKTQIVFVSGAFCDAKTFNWLRNILQVTLILQKPIQPHLFMQQIEGLLPILYEPESAESEDEVETRASEEGEYASLLNASAGIAEAQAETHPPVEQAPPPQMVGEVPSSIESGEYEELGIDGGREMRLQLKQMRKRQEVEERVRHAQRELRKAMPPKWEGLSDALAKLQADPRDSQARQESVGLAHQLKGTAGSLGLNGVSNSAGKIEDFLTMLDPSDDTEHEILWAEIFRALADGESDLRVSVDAATVEQREVLRVGRTLILCGNGLQDKIANLGSTVDIQDEHVSRPIDALLKASAQAFDAAIIDVGVCGKAGTIYLSRELRMKTANSALPIAYLVPAGEQFEPAEIVYTGVSKAASATSQDCLEQIMQSLAQSRPDKRYTVLTVDDDHVLTRFIKTILRSNDFNAESLNEPIHILDKLEEVQPDLVLLDVIMPGLSGFDVCRMLREHAKWRDLPVVFLTSKSDAQGRAAAFHAGGSDFLSKPILSEELVARVKAQLELSRNARPSQTSDDVSGVLKQDVFVLQCTKLLAATQANKGKLSLAMISMDCFDEYEDHGMFASYEVAATIGKLLKARYKPQALRGRWSDQAFILAVPGEEPQAVQQSLQLMAREVEQLSFMSEQGKHFDCRISSALAHYPDDADSFDDLVERMSDQLSLPGVAR